MSVALTGAVERGECDKAHAYTRDVAKWIMLFIIPVTAVFFLFPERVCAALYSRGLTPEQLDTAARLLRVQAICAFGKGGLTPVLVRFFGIVGAAGATAACYAVAAVLTLRSAYKCSPIAADFVKSFVVPMGMTAISAVAFFFATKLAATGGVPYFWQSVIGAVVFLVMYAAGVLLCGSIKFKDLKKIKN